MTARSGTPVSATSPTTSSAGRRPRSSPTTTASRWTSAAGFIAEFCAVGGNVTKRVFPPLNTTDYSSYAQQLPTDVDGTFVAVGGAGLIPFLKAYEQAHGPIDGKKFIGNLFWGTPGQFEQLGTARLRCLRRRRRHGRRPRHAGGEELRQQHHRQVVQDDPAGRRSRAAGVEHVHLRLLRQHLGPDQGPAGGQGRPLGRPEGAAGGAREGRRCRRPVRHDQARQEPPGDHHRLLPAALHEGRQAGGQDGRRRSRASTRRSAARSRRRRRRRAAPSRSA